MTCEILVQLRKILSIGIHRHSSSTTRLSLRHLSSWTSSSSSGEDVPTRLLLLSRRLRPRANDQSTNQSKLLPQPPNATLMLNAATLLAHVSTPMISPSPRHHPAQTPEQRTQAEAAQLYKPFRPAFTSLSLFAAVSATPAGLPIHSAAPRKLIVLPQYMGASVRLKGKPSTRRAIRMPK
ncbi:hypothetical protein LTR28_003755 [Elasticomyces elasticus]|nr:hypothetical protein LTR28_003755 [Elasticomyces elasticus]